MKWIVWLIACTIGALAAMAMNITWQQLIVSGIIWGASARLFSWARYSH